MSVSVLFSPICLDVKFSLDSCVASFWDRAALNHMFSLFCLIVILVVSHFGFEGGTLALIASVHCLPFTLRNA